MRLPVLRPKGSRELAIPELFGGMNLRDAVNMVNDNQLTDSLNMWKADGMLKTRPGVRTDNIFEIPNKAENTLSEMEEGEKTFAGDKVLKHKVFKDGIKGKMQLCSIPCKDKETGQIIKIFFCFVGNEDYEQLEPKEFQSGKGIGSYFVVNNDDNYYIYTNNQEIFKYTQGENDTYTWVKMNEEDYYAPLVLTHCKPLSQTGGVSQEKVMSSGVMIEGFNLIGNRYRMVYSTVNVNLLSDKTTSHAMVYTLLYSTHTSKYSGKKVIARLSNSSGTVVEHMVTLSGSDTVSWESDFQSDGLKMRVVGQVVAFFKESNGQTVTATVKAEDFVEDNLEIEAPYITTVEEKKRVFSMTQCEWYGGDSSGLAGGTRLFLCGNRNAKLKGLVTWSGLNDPTYFPENSYFYVGDKTEKVTGFGKQQDMLVIFKERETWYTQYERNTDITAEDLISQTVIDYTSSSVYFPLTQINPNIGCPYPESVQLCRNRLVWLGYNGAVHTLVSNNQYNERSIYTVSEMVQRRLKDEEGLSKVSSADWNGWYCLFVDNKLYLMDYNCYGFNYISSYSKTEDANIQIPWYYWELPDYKSTANGSLICVNDSLGFVSLLNNNKLALNDDVLKSFFDLTLLNDVWKGEMPIKCYFITKFFEFGAPHTRKRIERVNLQLGNNNAEPIMVEFITESGSETQTIVLDGDETESYNPAFIDSKALYPCVFNVLRLGIKLSCAGPMNIDGMILKYKFLGGAR